MQLDLVHDIQCVYRKTVDAMSRPGLLVNIKDQADKVDLELGCFKSTAVLAMMLLDTEVTFNIVSERRAEITKIISQLTNAKDTPPQRANFIFVLHDAGPVITEEALRSAHPGDLPDPHKSATIIIETDALSNDRDLLLTGPGIAGQRGVKVQTVGKWIYIRADKNAEYPLGIDFIFTDARYNVLCIPRTTQIAKQVVG